MAEDYRTTAQRLSDGQERLANRISQQRTTDEGGIGLLTTFLGPARYGASTAIRSFDDIRNLLGVLSTANKTNPVRKLIANELAAAEAAKRLAQPTLANAAKRTAALVPVAGAMQAGGGEGPQSVSSIRNIAIEPRVYGAIPGRPGTEVYAGVDAPPIPTPSPDAALKLGLIGGEAVAQDRNQGNLLSGLLGDIDYKGILNQLVKTFQRPEMLTPGVNALTAFGMSGAALNQAEIAGAAAEQERMNKLALEQIKNAPGAPKITSEAVKLYDRVNTSRANAALVQKMKQALIEGPGTGAIGTGEQALKAMLNALNLPIGTSGRTDYNSLLAELKTGMLRTGRLMKADFKLLEEQLPGSGTFTNRDQLLNALRKVEEKSNRQLYEDQQILKTFGLPAGSGAMPSTYIRSRNN
jgi:hypothetical protein